MDIPIVQLSRFSNIRFPVLSNYTRTRDSDSPQNHTSFRALEGHDDSRCWRQIELNSPDSDPDYDQPSAKFTPFNMMEPSDARAAAIELDLEQEQDSKPDIDEQQEIMNCFYGAEPPTWWKDANVSQYQAWLMGLEYFRRWAINEGWVPSEFIESYNESDNESNTEQISVLELPLPAYPEISDIMDYDAQKIHWYNKLSELPALPVSPVSSVSSVSSTLSLASSITIASYTADAWDM
jgi:hypothetical protein